MDMAAAAIGVGGNRKFPICGNRKLHTFVVGGGALRSRYGATGGTLSLSTRDRTVWVRMQALGLEFLGPQSGEAG